MIQIQINIMDAMVQHGMLYTKMKTKITISTILALTLLLNLTLALDISDTTFFSSESNSTIFANGTITVDSVVVSDTNTTIDNVQTNGARFDNTNATYDAILIITGLNSSEPNNDIRYSNGTVVRFTGNSQTITIPVGQYIQVGNYFTRQAEIDVCEGWTDGAETFISFFSIIVLLAVAGIILFFITGNGGEIDLTSIAFAILIAGITLSFGAVIIVQLSGC